MGLAAIGDDRPDGQRRLELSVGWHEVEVRDERGREIADRWIEVKPYDVATVAFGLYYLNYVNGWITPQSVNLFLRERADLA